jgi:hypothetical protein
MPWDEAGFAVGVDAVVVGIIEGREVEDNVGRMSLFFAAEFSRASVISFISD